MAVVRQPPADRLARALWQAWRDGRQPDLAAFLAQPFSLTPERLLVLVRVDQHERWRLGQGVPAEDYLARFPQLRDAAGAVGLVYDEILLRQERGDVVDMADYYHRFPAFADQLWERFANQPAPGSEESLRWLASMRPEELIRQLPCRPAAPETAIAGDTSHRPPATTPAQPPAFLPTLPAATGPAAPPTGPAVPGYEILGELGRGGAGVVYKARHLRLKRLVALKLLRASHLTDADALARFRTEAETIARLQHPNIVQVYDIGEVAGPDGGEPTPYLALEYLGGGSLADRLRAALPTAQEAARLVHTLALALHAAHGQQVIHRDLKPANVLLAGPPSPPPPSPFVRGKGEPQAEGGFAPSGSPSPYEGEGGGGWGGSGVKIADFGLAKRLDDASGPTQAGAVFGTPSYMAPEQAEGDLARVGPRTDLYALGAILYECLTGRPPFKAPTVLETLEQVRAQEPTPPRRLVPSVPRDLETICLKCLEKDPARRYASGKSLAKDLERFLAGEPISARPVGRLERGWRWCRKNPAVAALAGAVAVLVFGATMAAGWYWQGRTERSAELTAAVAEAEREHARARAADLGDLSAWSAALAAVRRAEGLLNAAGAEEETRRRVQELLADLEAEAGDRRMVARLAQVRVQRCGMKDCNFNYHQADPAVAFQEYGLDVLKLPPEEVAARLRGRRPAVVAELAAALDDWAWVLRTVPQDPPRDWRPLVAAARALDPDLWRNGLRDALGLAPAEQKARLDDLARTADLAKLPASSLVLLANALAHAGDVPGAVAFLERCHLRHTGDFWVNLKLAEYLSDLGPARYDDAIRHFAVTLGVRPHDFIVLNNLGVVYYNQDKFAKAQECWEDALRQRDDPRTRHQLASAYWKQGKTPQALKAFRVNLRDHPDFIPSYINCGILLGEIGQAQEALQVFQDGVKRDPDEPLLRLNLAVAWFQRQNLEQAEAEVRKVLAKQPNHPTAQKMLQAIRQARGP